MSVSPEDVWAIDEEYAGTADKDVQGRGGERNHHPLDIPTSPSPTENKESQSWATPESRSPSKNLHVSTALASSSFTSSTSGLQDSPSATSSDSPSSSVQSPPTPLPHTPLFSPSAGPLSPHSLDQHKDTGLDLPQPLVQAGWRRCWSSREQRYYFFNKLTQQTTWDLPTESSSRKRVSSDGRAHDQPYKKFIPSTDWDLTVSTNVQMSERVPYTFYPPHPDVEGKRVEAVHKLRQAFQDLAHLNNGLEIPTDCMNRWFLERKIGDKGRGPLLAAQPESEVSASMLRDLLNCVPVRMQKISTVAEARRQAGRYAEAAKRMAESLRQISGDHRKMIKWQCEAMFDWLRHSQHNAKFEEYLNRMKFLRNQCQPVLTEAIKPSLEQICAKVSQQARELALKLQDDHKQMLLDCGIDVTEHSLPPPRADKIVACYSAQLRFHTPKMPSISMEQTQDNWVRLKYKDTIKINAAHFFKIEQIYRYNCFDDKRFDLFLGRVWAMLRRYQCLYGPGPMEGATLQRSLPVAVFECIRKDLHVTFEAFASPLNCYFRQYCSLFPDTDGYFGSRGSFLQFCPLAGSISVNPPFCEELITATARHIVHLLRVSEERNKAGASFPLSFIVFLPEWQEPPLEAVEIFQGEGEEFLRRKHVLPAYDHFYRHGGQQWIQNRNELHGRSPYGTFIFCMQNTLGATRWPINSDKMDRISDAFKFPNASTPAANSNR